MNATTLLALAATLLSGGIAAAQGNHGHSGMRMDDKHGHMAGMDADRDGKVTKDEFMRFHEAMFDRMKGQDGTLSGGHMHMSMDCPMMQGADKEAGMGHGGGGMTDHPHRGIMGQGAAK